MDTKIKASFWSDATVESLDPSEKLAILWLFTANVSHCGWATATPRRFEFETGLGWSVLEKATQALGNALVKGRDGWWLRNYIRHQIGDGDKLFKNNMSTPIKASMAFAPTTIVAEIVAEYPKLFPENGSPSKALPECSRSTRAEQRIEEVLSEGKEVKEGNQKADWPERIVSAYPRRDSPMECMEAIATAIATGEAAEDILQAVREVAALCNAAPGGADNQYVPRAKTFFLERQWRSPEAFRERWKPKANGKPTVAEARDVSDWHKKKQTTPTP